MLTAVGLLLRQSAIAAGVALAVAALVAVPLRGDFAANFRVTAFAAGGVLLLFAATGSSPAMDRAVGQDTRTMLGRLMGRPDETFRGPRPSSSGVLLVAALLVFAMAVAVDL